MERGEDCAGRDIKYFPNSFASYFGILKCRQLMGYSFMKLQQQQHGQEK